MSKLFAIIPAAGRGQRFGAERPKQYQDIDGRCVLQRSIDVLLNAPFVTSVMCAIGVDDDDFSSCIAPDARLATCKGGATRAQSVINALEQLLTLADAQSWVMVHDAARPLLSATLLEQLWQQAQASDGQGAVLALASVDSLRGVGEDHRLDRVYDRDTIWRAQTPQCFPLAALLQALQDDPTASDESAAMIKAGFLPKLVAGSPRNLKITHPEDLALARFYHGGAR